MDNKPALLGAQEIDHEAPTANVSSSLDQNSCNTSPVSSAPSFDDADHSTGQTTPNVETAEEETIPSPVKVPRSKRRGLFGRFAIVAEVEEPKHYARKTKWFLTFNIALAALAAPLGSAIIFRES